MGIHDFFKITYNNVVMEECGELTELKYLANETVCLDASLIIHRAMNSPNAQNLCDNKGRLTNHILNVFNKVLMLNKNGIKQIWLFDSPNVNPIKKKELVKRDEARKKNFKQTGVNKFKLTSDFVKDVQDILRLLGITYMVSPNGIEAEQFGAYLTRMKIVKYMLTSDSDVIIFGGNMLREQSVYTASGKSKHMQYKIFELQKILGKYNITYSNLVKAGVILGNDFNDKTPRIGPMSVLNKLHTELTKEQQDSYNYFISDISNVIDSAEVVESKYNMSGLIEFLQNYDFNIDEKRLTKLKAFTPLTITI